MGGAERYAFELARHMAAASQAVTLLAFGNRDEEQRIDGLRVRVIGRPVYVRGQKTNPVAGGLIREILRAGTVHCHQQHVVASSMSALACRASGRKVFVSDLGGGGWDISSYISTDRWYHAHLHISEYSRRVFGHSGKKWAHVIYGGVDTEKFCPGPRDEDRKTVVFVGRMLPHKGVDDLVKALPPGMRLELIGQLYDLRFADDLRRLAEGKEVVFRTDCSDSDIIDAYRRALCVVLPSVYRNCYGSETRVPELLGQTLLEGMACGAPAVCTNVASMPEVVVDGETGFLVPPNAPDELDAKLCWLRDHPAQRSEMGAAARQRVLKYFTWNSVVERCLSVYASVA